MNETSVHNAISEELCLQITCLSNTPLLFSWQSDLASQPLEQEEDSNQLFRRSGFPEHVFFRQDSILELRTELGDISQEELARMLSVSVRTVRNWEKGKAAPMGVSVYYMDLLCQRAGVRTPQFFIFKADLDLG